MKTINRIIRFFVFSLCFNANTIYGQITRVEINNETLYQPIDSFIQVLSMKDTDLGVFRMYFKTTNFDPYVINEVMNGVSKSPLEGEIVVELELNRDGIFLRPPSHYFVYKDRPILIYSGVEQLMRFKKSEITKFIKKISYRLPPKGTVAFPLPAMRFMIKNGKVQSVPPKEDDK